MAELNLAHSLAENTHEAYRITDCGRCAQCLMYSVSGARGCVTSCDATRLSWWNNDACCTRSVLHWWGSSGTGPSESKVGSPQRPRSGGSLTAEDTGEFRAYTPAKAGAEADSPGSGVSLNTLDGAGSEVSLTPGAEAKGSTASLSQIDGGSPSPGGGDTTMAEAAQGDAEPATPPKESE